MAVLITGGAGYIGSHMVHELADRGEQPVVIDDFSSGFEWAIPSGVPVSLILHTDLWSLSC
jgi:UDP-glucose 4-epimerase